MDKPSLGYQVSLHSTYSVDKLKSPMTMTDVGHAFISLSHDGRIIGSAGLAPNPQKSWGIPPSFWSVADRNLEGDIYSEWGSLNQNPDLRTQTWDISEEQALKLMKHVEHQRDPKHGKPIYNAYRNNCADWAFDMLNHINVDPYPYQSHDFVSVSRPGVFHTLLSSPGTGNLGVPGVNELSLDKHHDNPDQEKTLHWLSKQGQNLFRSLDFQRSGSQARHDDINRDQHKHQMQAMHDSGPDLTLDELPTFDFGMGMPSEQDNQPAKPPSPRKHDPKRDRGLG